MLALKLDFRDLFNHIYCSTLPVEVIFVRDDLPNSARDHCATAKWSLPNIMDSNRA